MDPATDWVTESGKLSLDFDGTNDYIDLSDKILIPQYDD
jgi:hypothetical protein